MTTITQGHTGQDHAHDSHGEAHGPARGLARWLFTTNHKDIGTLYLVFALVMLFVGGGMALVIRAELFQPGLQFVNPEFFNQMTTMHALIMVFGMIMPAFVGFANWMIPMMAVARQPAGRSTRRWYCSRATRWPSRFSRCTCSACHRSSVPSTSS